MAAMPQPQEQQQQEAEREEDGLIGASSPQPSGCRASAGRWAIAAVVLVCVILVVFCPLFVASRTGHPSFPGGRREWRSDVQEKVESRPGSVNKPRVRREWRSLSKDVREKVAKAFWVMKNTSTADGRKRYGPRFMNYDDMSFWHACVVWDPRCDQGHLGPNFITYHRAYLLMMENSLLSVDPSVLAMPYWDFSLDSAGGKYENDPNKSIFSKNLFGSRDGGGDNFQVTDGLFANWPIPEWSSERFGKKSWLARDPANRCVREEWFRGRQADTCDKCCFSASWRYAKARNSTATCMCDPGSKRRTTVRNHADCTPDLNRWSKTPLAGFGKLAGSVVEGPSGEPLMNMMGNQEYKLMYAAADFDACVDFKNTPTLMAWQRCIEVNFPGCGDPNSRLSQTRFQNQLATLITRLTFPVYDADAVDRKEGLLLLDALRELAPDIELCKKNFSLYGYYDVLLEGSKLTTEDSRRLDQWALKAKRFVHNMHLTLHQFIGLDFSDLSSAAQDVGFFSGHHSNIDRSFTHWMINASSIAPQWYHYPKRVSQTKVFAAREFKAQLTGGAKDLQEAWGIGHVALCMTPFIADNFLQAYSKYQPFDPQSPWIPGTLLEDTISSGMPFKNLFQCAKDAPTGESCTGGKSGYTHQELLYWTHPSRTPYTYDSLKPLN